MKTHTTNYFNTLIEIAEDSKAISGTLPTAKVNKKTVAEMQYELMARKPYRYTSDDINFKVFADRNDLTETEYKEARAKFFAKGQPCFRTSSLAKTYGFGIHSDENGKVALYGMETEEYQRLLSNDEVKKVKAMRSSKRKS